MFGAADRIIVALGYRGCDTGQIEDGPGNLALQSSRERERTQKGERTNDRKQRPVDSEPGIELTQISLQINCSQSRAALHDRLKHDQSGSIEFVPIGSGLRRKLGGRLGFRESCEQIAL